MPDVAVRRARPEDIPPVIALHERCWRISYAGLADADAKFARGVEEWARLWGGILDRTRVVELHGAVAGFVVFGPSRDADATDGSGEIQALYVDPDAQGAGLGAALVAQGQDLPLAAEDDLLVGDQPGQPDRVDPDPLDLPAPDPGDRLIPRGAALRFAGGGDRPGRAQGGARGGVGLVLVVQLDDLGGRVETPGHGGEVHGQHRPEGEVGCPHGVAVVGLAGQVPEVVHHLGGQPGGARDQVDALAQQPLDGGRGGLGPGEVDHHLGLGGQQVGEVLPDHQPLGGAGDQVAQGPADPGGPGDRGDQVQIGRVQHRLAGRPPHPACRPQHPDPHRPPPSPVACRRHAG